MGVILLRDSALAVLGGGCGFLLTGRSLGLSI